MDNTFNFGRFGRYVRQYTTENWKMFAIYTATVWCVMVFLAAFVPFMFGTYNGPLVFESWKYQDIMWSREMTSFWFTFFLLFIVGAGSAFKIYGERQRRFNLLTIPASKLEKFLTYFLVSVVGTFAIFVIGYYIADFTRVLTAPLYASEGFAIKPMPISYFFNQGFVPEEPVGQQAVHIYESQLERHKLAMTAVYSILSVIIGFMLLASTIWTKRGVLLGVLAGLALNFILPFISALSIGRHLFSSRRFEFNLTLDQALWIFGCGAAVVTIGLILLAYRRFTELETIDRW